MSSGKSKKDNAALTNPSTSKAETGKKRKETVITFEDAAESSSAVLSKAERGKKRKEKNNTWKLNLKKLNTHAITDVNEAMDEDVFKEDIPDLNPRHSEYFREQLKSLREDTEWRAFQKSLASPLPVTFRVSGGCADAIERRLNKGKFLETKFNAMKGRYIEIDGVILKDQIVNRVKWFENGANNDTDAIWQLCVSPSQLSRTSGLQPLSDWLIREVTLGHVVRQEIASMIPAYCLQIEPFHDVLDVCAAPGSKTEQLLRIMHSSSSAKGGTPSGMVVANDADARRIRTLRNRMPNGLGANLLITNARAEDLLSRVRHTMTKRENSNYKEIGVFDRIVADVPCSGDGTIRKFPHNWRLFRPRTALDLHPIQLQIAISAIMMLRPGGRMVYSTCSINPLEDEAVVSGILRYFNSAEGQVKYQTQYMHKESKREIPRSKDKDKGISLKNYALQLVDIRAAPAVLPNLKTREGLSTWSCDRDTFVLGDPTENARAESLTLLPPLRRSMYPPTAEEVAWMKLSRCHRVLPQDMDTGGFFVAVLEMVEIMEKEKEAGRIGRSEGGNEQRGVEVNVSLKESDKAWNRLGYNPHQLQQGANGEKAKEKGGTKKGKKKEIAGGHEDMHVYKYAAVSEDKQTELLLSAGIRSTSANVSVIQALGYKSKLSKQKGGQRGDSIPKKKQKTNENGTIFGSKSKGWALPAKDEEDEKNGDSGVDVAHAVLCSPSVLRALKGWAAESWVPEGVDADSITVDDSDGLVVQAGQAVLNIGLGGRVDMLPSAPQSLMKLMRSNDKRGASYVRVHKAADLMFIAMCRTYADDASDVDDFLHLCEELSYEEGRESLVPSRISDETCNALLQWRVMSERGELDNSKYVYFVLEESAQVGLKEEERAAVFAIEGGGKRRLSKAEKKNLTKFGKSTRSAASNNVAKVLTQSTTATSRDARGDGSSGTEAVIALRYEHSDDGELICHWVTSAELCSSYIQHFSFDL